MKLRKVTAAAAVALALALTATACGGDDKDSDAARAAATKIKIGIKYDQPGLGLKEPDGSFSGFDVDVATYVAKELGYEPDQIEWVETKSADRENALAARRRQVHRGHLLDHRRAQGRRSTSPARTCWPTRTCWSRRTRTSPRARTSTARSSAR